MGLQSALSTALTGLNASETTIDVVGNNVANSNTIGFKASDAVFATQFLQTQGLGAGPTDNRGGTNPRQIGLGTKVAEITPDFTQGTIEISSNASDLAIQGEGFFIVEDAQGGQLYTRNGLFKTNSQNELVTVNGQRLLGFGVNDAFEIQRTGLQPIDIPLGAAAVAQATQNVFMEGTLTPTGEIGDTPNIIESALLSDGSKEIPTNLDVSDISAIVRADFSAADPPAADTTAGTITAGTYTYKIAFADAFGNESAPSLELGPITTTGTGGVDQSILLDSLPLADGTNFTLRNIYRMNSAGSGDYEFVASLTNGDGTSYVDSVGDAGLPGGDTLNEETLPQGNFGYYVTFLDTASGLESRPTQLIGPEAITVDGRRIRIENIPQPVTGDFDAVKIYRNTAADTNTFYEVATLSGGETTYIDSAQDADIAVSGNELNLHGPPLGFGVKLVDIARFDGSSYNDEVFKEGTLTYTARKGGRTLGTKTLDITADTDVSELIAFLEDASGIHDDASIPGTPGGAIVADAQGRTSIEFISNMGADNAIDIGLSAFTLTEADGTVSSVDLPFTQTQEANGESTIADFVVFDSLGIPLDVRVTTVLESTSSTSTTFRWYADSPDNDPVSGSDITVGTGLITFDGEGNVSSVSNSTVSIDRRNVSSASPLEFNLDLSQISGLAAEQSSLAATRQDGSEAGTLTSFIITESGAIRGVFSNGVTRDLGEVRLVRFANNSGLEQVGENLFAAGVNSGLPVEGAPGEQGIGTIIAGAVELSNTDIGQNLIDLILASTQYRGGTRVITAVQQLLDELLNLRR